MSKNNFLQISNISKKYLSKNQLETYAVRNLSLSMDENEMVAVMGSSGSGKTTLIHILTGLLSPDKGQVFLKEQDIMQMSKDEAALFRRKNIGIVFQNYNLLNSLTVDENIRVPLILDGQWEHQDEKVEKVAKLLGISDELKKYPYEISGGQQQRVGIARAIINQPKMIFADEPTGNLDSKSTKQVMEYFVHACQNTLSGLLMVTHDAIAASYCHRVVFLQDGHIVFEVYKKGAQQSFYNTILEVQKEWVK